MFFSIFRRETDSLKWGGNAVGSDFLSPRKEISGRLGNGNVWLEGPPQTNSPFRDTVPYRMYPARRLISGWNLVSPLLDLCHGSAGRNISSHSHGIEGPWNHVSEVQNSDLRWAGVRGDGWPKIGLWAKKSEGVCALILLYSLGKAIGSQREKKGCVLWIGILLEVLWWRRLVWEQRADFKGLQWVLQKQGRKKWPTRRAFVDICMRPGL